MAEDATRVVTIVKVAGRDFRNVARHAYESIVEKEVEAPKAAVRRKTAAVKRRRRLGHGGGCPNAAQHGGGSRGQQGAAEEGWCHGCLL